MSLFTATKEQPAYRDRIGYQAMLLAGICALVATLILLGNTSTKQKIAENQRLDTLQTLDQVLPRSLYDNDPIEDQLIIENYPSEPKSVAAFIARKASKIVGFALPIRGSGYGGDIQMLLGIDIQGQVLGIRVLSHAETPGLGDKIEINKDDWITAFNGLSLANTTLSEWAVKKDGGKFDQFTGATITPRAVVNALRQALLFYQANHIQFFQSQESKLKKSQEGEVDSHVSE